MSKITSGEIPTKVAVIKAKPEKAFVGCKWDREWNSKDHLEEVTPAFIANPDSKESLETGKAWAKQTDVTVIANFPEGVRIFNLESRGRGGRAYKVIHKGLYVDLREDVLMDALLNCNVKNGWIEGNFLWARLSSQMRLVRVGSSLYEEIKKLDVKKDLKPLSKKNLEIGQIYSNKKGEKAIFLGYVNQTKFILKSKNTYEKQILNKNAMAFLEIPNYIQNIMKFVNDCKNNTKDNIQTFYFKVVNSNSYVTKENLNKINIDFDIFEKNRTLSKEYAIKYITSPEPLYYFDISQRIKDICYYLDYVNVFSVNDKEQKIEFLGLTCLNP